MLYFTSHASHIPSKAEEKERRVRAMRLIAQIPPSSLSTFTQTYSTLLKASMAPNMRKRDKKREKAKAELREKKRKEVWVDVEIGEGGKRGNGHRQRVNSVAPADASPESHRM